MVLFRLRRRTSAGSSRVRGSVATPVVWHWDFGSLATSAQERRPEWWLLGLLWLMSLLRRELEAELLGEREVKA
jgi:hypothetical protein